MNINIYMQQKRKETLKSRMGNCLFGGLGEENDGVIKVVTSNGGIMEFCAPVTVDFITNEFPGHGIFRSNDLFWKPLCQFDELVAGQSYYLLPLDSPAEDPGTGGSNIVRHGHIRSNSIPTITSLPAPYRMSLDYQYQGLLKRSQTDGALFSKSNSSRRFWKVKLVISPQQLLEILSQEARTQELVESVRMVAKCGINNGGGMNDMISSAAASIMCDQWSLSSSGRKDASSNQDALLVDI